MTVSSVTSSSLPPYAVAAALGVALAWLAVGSPGFILAGGMVGDTDYANAAAAFAIFVRDGWHWPLGANPEFGGINAFYSDISPWFALLARAIRGLTGVALPFHTLILVNFVLFAMMAWRLMASLTTSRVGRWTGVLLLACNLVMPVRMLGAQHISLASYWVVLWAMTAVPLRGDDAPAWRRWEFLAALGVATWSHAYVAAMSVVVILAFLAGDRRWLAAVAAIVWPLLLLWAVGALGQERVPLGGAKLFALDIAAFAGSLGWGLLPQVYEVVDIQQGDTVVYLGTGALLALIAAFVWSAATGRLRSDALPDTQPQRRRLLIVAVAAIALAGFAVAFNLRVAGPVWIDLPIPSVLSPLYESFRAAGRFGGVLTYLLIAVAAIWLGNLSRRNRFALAVAASAVVLQLGDLGYAGRKAAPAHQAAVAEQSRALDVLFAGTGWSGRVFRDVEQLELEDQRLIDYLLVQRGARHFEVAHGARLVPAEVQRRSGYAQAVSGDLVITSGPPPKLACRAAARIKAYDFCLVGDPA